MGVLVGQKCRAFELCDGEPIVQLRALFVVWGGAAAGAKVQFLAGSKGAKQFVERIPC